MRAIGFLNLILVLQIAAFSSISGAKLSPVTAKSVASKPEIKDLPPNAKDLATIPVDLKKYCNERLSSLPGAFAAKDLDIICQQVQTHPNCKSVKGEPIFYFDKTAQKNSKAKKILAISLIHGDEYASGTVTRTWMTRLQALEPRNYWRVIPIANPDGLKLKTRTNASGVDINRNFPTLHWNDEAIQKWKAARKGDPRRFPGPSPASEVETQCLMGLLEEFKPDFIISIHTPLGVLDFDGPKMQSPQFSPLPWVSLGNFPGSLGRYMWKDRSVPVLTIELKSSTGIQKLEDFDRLQDISGTIAIQADRILRQQNRKEVKTTDNN